VSVHEVDAPARTEPARPVPPRPRGGLGFADRWPFRRKLNVLVGVPLVVVATLLAYVISGLVSQAQDAASAAQLVRDSRQVAELVDRLQTEHQQALLLSVRYESATSGKRPSLVAYRQAQTAVDTEVALVRTAFGSRLPEAEAEILREINGLGSLRATVEQSYLPADNIDPAYTAMVDGLIDGLGLESSEGQGGNLATTRTGGLLDSLLRAEAAHSSFETRVFSAQTGDPNALIEFVHAVGYEQLYAYQTQRFGRYASQAQQAQLSGTEQGTAWNAISMQYAGLQIDPSALVAKSSGQVRAAFTQALRAYPGYQREAQNRLDITGDLIGQIAQRADAASDDAWWRAAWLLGVTLLAFALWLALSVAIRRSVVRPVQALTGAAMDVAEATGQELARVADDDAIGAGPPRLREVPVTARDEIGDLAEAFNRVQHSAAALLERQVVSRRNVAEMFGNVGRRVSNLTGRQLTLIDAVERGETDPALLDRLYRIDHLAVRLQRNADSLMLLAGIREAGLDAGPTALTNVVRAALGQIEGFQRVSLTAEADVTLAPDIVADLTLMLAELLENAVAFSPARSGVEVTVRAGSDGASVEVTDHGLGMSAERLSEENARLIRRERLDLVPTKVLGLFVVGSLARRWDVQVVLTRTPGGGVTSRVTIPSPLLLLMSPFTEPGPVTTAPATADAATGPVPADAAPASAGTASPLPRRVPHPQAAEATIPPPRRGGDELASGGGSDRSGDAPRSQEAAHAVAAAPTTEPTRLTPRTRTRTPQWATGSPDGTAPAPAAQTSPYGPRSGRPAPAGTAGGPAPEAPARALRPRAGDETARRDAAPARTAVPAAAPCESESDEAARPLRRRVRGATLRTTFGEAGRPVTPQGPRVTDAEEVRSTLDEFEAAIARAHRDTAAAAPHAAGPGAGAAAPEPTTATASTATAAPVPGGSAGPDPSPQPAAGEDSSSSPQRAAGDPSPRRNSNTLPEGADQ
jgi:signal transduction histidine kinase